MRERTAERMGEFRKSTYRTLAVLLFISVPVTCIKQYQSRFPNGDKVPNPCSVTGGTWEGVGHFMADGGGMRNQFGLDFVHAGKEWTSDLCRMDSDGDGLTNGQELGDPDCIWKVGDTPSRQEEITHPGICDPWNSPTCFRQEVPSEAYGTQEAWMEEQCAAGPLDCPAINEAGMLHINYTLNSTPVPAKETTYMCQVFEVPDGDYHMVAMEPIVDNKNIMHHMVLFGCTDQQEVTGEPFECDMIATQYCRDFLSVWTLGLSGVCAHPESGTVIGTSGFKKVAIQYHWFNPQQTEGYTDSSGMTLHYTPNKRYQDAGMLLTGAIYFVLEPGQKEVTVTSSCTETCTKRGMTEPIYITSAWNHMHYAGAKMSIEVLRNKTHHRYLTDDQFYNYDSPRLYEFDPPVELLPGDELKTRCTFNTENNDKTLFFGDATSDEMCLGFLSYYPKPNFENGLLYCLDRMEVIFCDPNTYADCPDLLSMVYGRLGSLSQIQANCRQFGPCVPECVDAIVDVMQTNKCFQGKYLELLQGEFLTYSEPGRDLLVRMASCTAEVDRVLNPRILVTESPNSSATPLKAQNVCALLVLLAMSFLRR